MHDERRKGFEYSTAIHAVILLLIIFGLPSLLSPTPPVEPVAITVELLPITGVTNVKPVEAPPTPAPKPVEATPAAKPAPAPVKNTAKTPTPPSTKASAPPPPAETPKPDAKPVPKKPEKTDKSKEDSDKDDPAKEKALNDLLKNLQKEAQKADKPDKPKQASAPAAGGAKSSSFDPNQMMSLSEKDAIMSQLARCWNPPAGAKDAQNLTVLIEAEYSSDGANISAELAPASKAKAGSDPYYRAAAEAALRAIKQCSPLKLPIEKYAAWKSIELNFDPRFMLQ